MQNGQSWELLPWVVVNADFCCIICGNILLCLDLFFFFMFISLKGSFGVWTITSWCFCIIHILLVLDLTFAMNNDIGCSWFYCLMVRTLPWYFPNPGGVCQETSQCLIPESGCGRTEGEFLFPIFVQLGRIIYLFMLNLLVGVASSIEFLFFGSLGQVVAVEWQIEAVPTFIFFREGVVVDKFVGAKKEELLETITKHANAPLAAWVPFEKQAPNSPYDLMVL